MKVTVILLSLFYTSWQLDNSIEKSENPAEVPTTVAPDQTSSSAKEKCLIELELDHSIFEELDSDIVSVKNNTEYGNYLSCYWKMKKLQEENGTINFIELEKLVKYSVIIAIDLSDVPLLNTWLIATKIVDECKNIQGKTHGEKAVKMRNCLFEKLLQQRNAQAGWEDFEDIPNLDFTEEDCVNELKLDGLKIEDINRHYVVPENITEFNDFLGCYWRKDNVMDQDGNFNISALRVKLDEVVENELLARSRIVYLSDIITESIVDGCREIKGNNDGELVLKVQNYIIKRIPYFKIIL